MQYFKEQNVKREHLIQEYQLNMQVLIINKRLGQQNSFAFFLLNFRVYPERMEQNMVVYLILSSKFQIIVLYLHHQEYHNYLLFVSTKKKLIKQREQIKIKDYYRLHHIESLMELQQASMQCLQ
ncbi:unnamed protein product (macronuclear) [Paramecium tetraurelia]|uniref:Transmembrane protein n=1 Tax=Paramecium tetraurelia TaxID=5888 RepID=A0BRJ1_PARTE|nr:uncharacterized protein GSPATT00031389001 [Paramecium tetraurelia]CAK61158.1 unnamed protein product [Paramecium tetraurelia]|eukprot:XP_001428556.1 hypothetical protein (macronuclear) [Paramecium tetraurelia strain d4-2]